MCWWLSCVCVFVCLCIYAEHKLLCVFQMSVFVCQSICVSWLCVCVCVCALRLHVFEMCICVHVCGVSLQVYLCMCVCCIFCTPLQHHTLSQVGDTRYTRVRTTADVWEDKAVLCVDYRAARGRDRHVNESPVCVLGRQQSAELITVGELSVQVTFPVTAATKCVLCVR